MSDISENDLDESQINEEGFDFLVQIQNLKESLIVKALAMSEKALNKTIKKSFRGSVQLTEEEEEKLEMLKQEHLDERSIELSEKFELILADAEIQSNLNQIFELEKQLPKDIANFDDQLLPLQVKYLDKLKAVQGEVEKLSEKVSSEEKETKSNLDIATKRLASSKRELLEVRVFRSLDLLHVHGSFFYKFSIK